MNNKNFYLAIILLFLSTGTNFAGNKSYPYQYLYKNLPFEMPIVEEPIFPNNSIKLTEYGGVADGVTLNTEAFAEAINSLSEKGGGTLIVPSGVWYTGPIVFKSNINLHLERGALILFTANTDAYPTISTNFEGQNTRKSQSPISGKNLENIAITGEGAINGSGDAWRPLKKNKVTDGHWKDVVRSGGVLKNDTYWVPSENAESMRPVMVNFVSCKNVLLQGVLFENSPAWNIHPLMCENLIIDGIFVRNPSYAQNGDGLDIESCKNVLIVNTTLDVGDDAICLKSGKDEQGRKRGIPTENVIVDNCRVFKGHGGFVVGSEMSGGVRNISVSNCQFMGTDVGLRFKSARGRGGVVENIYIKEINMFNIVHEPLVFDLYYFAQKTDKIPAIDETTPVFKDIYISDIVSRNSNKAMTFNGLPEMNITNINIENVVILSKLGAELSESQNIKFKNVTIIPEEEPVLTLNNVNNVDIDTFSVPDSVKTVVKITGERSYNIKLPQEIDKSRIIKEENIVQK